MDNIKMTESYLRQAEERLKHAKEALSDNYAYAIRQSQEAVELALKASELLGLSHRNFMM